ncbi:MAG: hypothetical protein KKB81_07805 [Candidatus Margulisbacteria bacterium]|nr:hypothetical protein [Candidatus Margulisiibacteriota bacterium]MBU1022530.1 hypothetical protein [Candidatus Margulisiibacteriota bacterium]MBU1955238.1 hypothetical protein [Candidatus Margulisiibacteriota bacterium]
MSINSGYMSIGDIGKHHYNLYYQSADIKGNNDGELDRSEALYAVKEFSEDLSHTYEECDDFIEYLEGISGYNLARIAFQSTPEYLDAISEAEEEDFGSLWLTLACKGTMRTIEKFGFKSPAAQEIVESILWQEPFDHDRDLLEIAVIRETDPARFVHIRESLLKTLDQIEQQK